jgi:hypothetical protein
MKILRAYQGTTLPVGTLFGDDDDEPAAEG